jgi:flagellar protein FlaG
MDILSVSSPTSSGAPSLDRLFANAITPQATKAAAPAESQNSITPTGSVATLASKEQISKAVESINKSIRVVAQNIEFSVDHDSKQVIVKVVDQQTKQVLRQIPNEEILEIAKSLDKLQGLLIKQTA